MPAVPARPRPRDRRTADPPPRSSCRGSGRGGWRAPVTLAVVEELEGAIEGQPRRHVHQYRHRRGDEEGADAPASVGRVPPVGDQEGRHDEQRRHAAADREREQQPGGQAPATDVVQATPHEEHRRPDEVAGRRGGDQHDRRGQEGQPDEVAVGMLPGPNQPGQAHDGYPGRGCRCEVDGQVAADRVEDRDDRLEHRNAWVPRRGVVEPPDQLRGLEHVADVDVGPVAHPQDRQSHRGRDRQQRPIAESPGGPTTDGAGLRSRTDPDPSPPRAMSCVVTGSDTRRTVAEADRVLGDRPRCAEPIASPPP